MSNAIYLVRHGEHGDLGSRLSGRSGAVGLSPNGERQARSLRDQFGSILFDRIETSPVRRCRETAAIIAERQGVPVAVVPALDEVAFGEWEGLSFAELEDDPRWRDWNAARSVATAPEGETMVQVQQRALAHVLEVAASGQGMSLLMVTHCDVIRAIVAGILGLSLDNLLRFSVDPASVTHIEAGRWGARLRRLNEGRVHG